MTRVSFVPPWVLRFVCLSCLLTTLSARAASVPALDHIVVVVMENENNDQVQTAPYIAQFAAHGSSFSNYRAIGHPSQPNYIALWSGDTQGVTGDQCPAGGRPWMTENLGHLLEAKGLSWRAYSEDLPAVGSSVCKASGGLYTRKHDPWTYFGNLDHQNERPYADLASDIAAGTLPALAFVIPNNNDNMHDRPVAFGDAWLARNLPAMIDAVGPRGAVVLTWDENDNGAGNQVLTVIAGAQVKPGFISDRPVSHYTLLRTICDALRLEAPGLAASETPIADIWKAAELPIANIASALSAAARYPASPR